MMHKPFLLLYSLLILTLGEYTFAEQGKGQTIKSHGLSIIGKPRYPADFKHFKYANPNAPKGGVFRKAATGTFDTFNTFAPKGNWAADSYSLYDSLMVRAGDEPYSVYGLIAESIEYPEDLSSVTYHLRPGAKFHDGVAIKPSDVVFTFKELVEKGPPHYRHLYSGVIEVNQIGKRAVQFQFKETQSKSLILRLSQLRVLPEHYWGEDKHDISKADLKPPLGSGAYQVLSVEPGRKVTYERVKDYWAADLPVNKGRHNFNEIKIEYFRDETVALEAFKQGDYDFRMDGNPKNWALSYQGKALERGEIIQEKIPNSTLGMRAFVFNLRKPLFEDQKVRQAISLALDFKWINKHLYFDIYKQAYSLFSNSELAASGLPEDSEMTLLKPWQNSLMPEVLELEWLPVATSGTGEWRQNRIAALRLLHSAGWLLEKGELRHGKTGAKFEFDILISQPEYERFVIPFSNNLAKLGIKANIKSIDTSQYINRLRKFDFDMVIHGFYPSISPGAELKNFWGSKSANADAGQNISGISLPVLDDLIEQAIAATDRQTLVSICRAIDRIVLWHYAVIPQWYLPYWPVIYRKEFAHPETPPLYENGLSTWWYRQ